MSHKENENDPLNDFLHKHRRLPKLGDDPPPYSYRGWLLRYVALAHTVIPEVNNRWDYHQRTLRAGRLLDEPIPSIDFLGCPDGATLKALTGWMVLTERQGSSWNGLGLFVDWLAYGLAVASQPPQIHEALQIRLYQTVQIHLLLQHPYDYFGHIISERRSTGWNPHAFFPTPTSVVDLMVQCTMDELRSHSTRSAPSSKTVLDPCCGTGRMLLSASNRSVRLYGIDIDPLLCKIAAINGALYAPWLAFPFPEHYFTTPAPPFSAVTEPDAPPHYIVHAHHHHPPLTQTTFDFEPDSEPQPA